MPQHPPRASLGQLHGVDRRVDDQATVSGDLPRLLEEPEGKAGCHAEPHVLVASATHRGSAVCRHLARLGADLEKEAALVGGLSLAQVLDLDGITRNPVLVVVNLDLDEVRAANLCSMGQPPHDLQVTQTDLAENAGDHNQRQQHAEQQVQQVVAGVDRGEADTEGDPDEVLAFARDA